MLKEGAKRRTKEDEILEILKVILDRLDDIEDKLNQQNDPYNFNNYFYSQNNKMPERYTLIDTSGTQ